MTYAPAPLSAVRAPLRFRQLRIRRMPGFEHAGFVLDGLSTGVNVVYGPNASGKTTAARALQTLLWPTLAPSRSTSISGDFSLGGGEWSLDLDAGRLACQRNGAPADPPAWPPPEHASRYNLSLHELLTSTDQPLAEAVLRESAGGYDVSAAADALSYRERASVRPPEAAALERARKDLMRARRAQEHLRAEEIELRDLEVARQEADAAATRLVLLEQALDVANAAEAERAAQDRTAAFPDGMAALRPDDGERLSWLSQTLDAAGARAREADRAAGAAEQALDSLAVPEGGIPAELLATLRVELQELRGLEMRIQTGLEECEKALRQRDAARRLIGHATDDDRLAGLDHLAMDEIASHARDAERLNAELAAVEAQRRWLGADPAAHDLDVVRRAVDLLSGWLAAADRPGQDGGHVRTAQLAAGGLAALSGIALAALVDPWFLLVTGLAIALSVWSARSSSGLDPRAAYRREFGRLSVDPPAAWDPAEVARRRNELDRELADGRVEEEKARRWEELSGRIDELEAAAAALEEQRTELIERLGVAPGTDGAGLFWLASRISDWHEADRQVVAAQAASDVAARDRATLVDRVWQRLRPYGYERRTNAAELAGAVEDLERRRDLLVRLQHDRDAAFADRNAAAREITAVGEERARIFDRLGLAPGSDGVVREWCERQEAYQAAKERLLLATSAARTARAKLEALPGYEPGLSALGRQALEREIEDARLVARTYDQTRDRIVRIRTRIDDAKQGHRVEEALAAVDRCEAGLQEACERDSAAVVGWTLAGFVQQQSRNHAQPDVFRRASELFARMTRGRYQLDFERGDPPAFRARDTLYGTGHGLDELSGGTRVQLLLAVRVAFVEQQEYGGARLPLLFDETLANSDDERAEAIMVATIELCRDGRQLFFFTAQADEVAKWLALLEREHGATPYRVFDLIEARRLGRRIDLTAFQRLPSRPRDLPDPAGLDHAAYGRAIDPPPIDPRPEAIGQTHLWYLIEDVDTLHNLLGMGIESWGAFQTLIDHGGTDIGEIAASLYHRAAAAAHVLEAVLETAAIGRGRSVDRAALDASGAVSGVFIDAIDRLCRDVDGDAARLIQALEAGEVPRFQRSKVRQLRERLEHAGYLDQRPRASSDEIRARALGAAASNSRAGYITLDEVHRLLARLRRG